MNIINQTNYTYGLKFYGIEDLSIGWEVKYLIESQSDIIKYFDSREEWLVESLNDYIDYLWVSKFCQFDAVVPYVKKNVDQVILLVTKIKEYSSKYNIGIINKYLIANFKEVFESDNDNHYYYDMIRFTIDWIFRYSSSFPRTILEYLENKYWYLIADNFQKYSGYYKKNLDAFKSNIINNGIAEKQLHNYDRVFKILELTNKEPFLEASKNVASHLSNHILKMLDEITGENYVLVMNLAEKIKKIAKAFKLPQANNFDNKKEKISKASDDFFEKNGRKFQSDPIDVGKFVKELKEQKAPMIIKLMSISHIYKKDKNMFVSQFDDVMTAPSGMFDLISHVGLEFNEYFLPSRINMIHFYTKLYNGFLHVCFNDLELNQEIFDNYYLILGYMKKDGVITQEELEEFHGLYSILNFSLEAKEDNMFRKSLNYGLSMLISVFIEKIIRFVFLSEVSEENEYFEEKYFTLGALLQRNEITLYFGEHLIKVVEFQLLKVRGTDIGMNIRNSLMHDRNEIYSSMNLGYPIQLLYILFSILNAVTLHYMPPFGDKKFEWRVPHGGQLKYARRKFWKS